MFILRNATTQPHGMKSRRHRHPPLPSTDTQSPDRTVITEHLDTTWKVLRVGSGGMAVGGGLYWTAAATALVILILLIVVGQMESIFGLKIRRMVFRLTTQILEPTMSAANAAFAESKVTVERLRVLRMEQEFVLEFEAHVGLHQQKKLAAKITPLGTKFELLFTLASRSTEDAG